MNTLRIQTPKLELVLQTREETLAQLEQMAPQDKAMLSADWLARLEGSAPSDPWIHGFAMVHRVEGGAVGQCGFKGPPGLDGMVEIAYSVDPDHQGKGYATEAAEGLTAYALGCAGVHLVCAHTLPEANASTRVLTKCGFRHVGEVIDPEDGLVWRWEKLPNA